MCSIKYLLKLTNLKTYRVALGIALALVALRILPHLNEDVLDLIPSTPCLALWEVYFFNKTADSKNWVCFCTIYHSRGGEARPLHSAELRSGRLSLTLNSITKIRAQE